MTFLRLPLLACLLAAAPAAAEQPWLEPGDIQARQDVEILKAARFIRGPVEAWPLPWRQVDEGIERVLAGPAPAHIRAAANRLSRLADMAELKTSYEVRAAGTNRPAIIRGFASTAREQADVSVRVSRSLGRLYVSSGFGYRSDQAGRDYHLEPSYGALTLGNWLVYGGYVEKYWGPGYDGALTIGTNARPFPKAGVQRLYPYRPEPKFLRWIGPWRFDFWGGVLTEKRRDSTDPVQFGMQFSMEPAKGLELNFKRTLMICGGTRAGDAPNPTAGGVCGPGPITRGLIPFFPGSKPGDSLAGFSISYARMFGPVSGKIYYDVMGEDKAGEQQFEQMGQTGGASFTGPIGGGGASWTAVGEFTDTLANFWFQGDNREGSFYNNVFYFDGKTYRGQSFGHAVDGDSKMLTLSGSVTDVNNRRFYGSYRDADIYFTEALNPGGEVANRLSANREKIRIVTAGTEWPTPIGDVRVEGRYMTDKPNTPGEKDDSAEFEVGWRTRF